jgi:predicted nucleic acid-binding protein
MPVADFFLDTNILLYAVSTEPAEAEKTRVARSLVQTADWAWSAQVAAEFVRAGTSSRLSRRLTREEARRWLETWLAFPMAVVDGSLVLDALSIGERFMLPHFDSQIIAAARRLGCATLYSEDFNHGQNYGGVSAVNPFLLPLPG